MLSRLFCGKLGDYERLLWFLIRVEDGWHLSTSLGSCNATTWSPSMYLSLFHNSWTITTCIIPIICSLTSRVITTLVVVSTIISTILVQSFALIPNWSIRLLHKNNHECTWDTNIENFQNCTLQMLYNLIIILWLLWAWTN